MAQTIKIALVKGDGSGPEMMVEAVKVAQKAALLDNIQIEFVETPMGWNAYKQFGDTLPESSLKTVLDLGLVFFGGVGDFEYDKTIGVEKPQMRPELRVLLALRKQMGLLINFRPIYYYKALVGLSNIKPETITRNVVKQVWMRFLLEDSYFGNEDLLPKIPQDVAKSLGIKLKKDISGSEEIVTDLAYYKKSTIQKFLRSAFSYAKSINEPIIIIDKSNVVPRYELWRKTALEIAKEFPGVPVTNQLVDSANALLFTPEKLSGVIACGNEHGDILSDGAAGAMGSMGLMCSSAINPDTKAAMFESGAGTAPTIKGQDKANPIGRILTGGMMLKHIGAENGAQKIEDAVTNTLLEGYRTVDLFTDSDDKAKLLGTKAMGDKISSYIS